MSELWYRYVDVSYAAPADEFGESRGHGHVEVHLQEYKVVRTTPKGVWIERDLGGFSILGDRGRFVLREARKRFACPTKEEAMESFVARKKAQIRIHSAQIRRAEEALAAAKRSEQEVKRA